MRLGFIAFCVECPRPEPLIGKSVTIRAISPYGSARLLDGLHGTVIAAHPIAPDWVKVRLEPNPVTPEQEWSVPVDRLVVRDEAFPGLKWPED